MDGEARVMTYGVMTSGYADAVGCGGAGVTVLAEAQAHAEGPCDVDVSFRVIVLAVGVLSPLSICDGGGCARISFASQDASSGVPGASVGDGLGGCEAAAGSHVAAPVA